MTTRERIDASREARLWITTLLTASGVAVTLFPGLPTAIGNKIKSVGSWFKDRFKKEPEVVIHEYTEEH